PQHYDCHLGARWCPLPVQFHHVLCGHGCHREVEVMLLRYSPQRADHQLSYAFPAPDVIEATLDGVSDVFDFSALPDGELDVSALETTLPIGPIISARRVNGQLEVTLLKFHGPNPTPQEAFPEPEVIE